MGTIPTGTHMYSSEGMCGALILSPWQAPYVDRQEAYGLDGNLGSSIRARGIDLVDL